LTETATWVAGKRTSLTVGELSTGITATLTKEVWLRVYLTVRQSTIDGVMEQFSNALIERFVSPITRFKTVSFSYGFL
jgi:hypothetical protein